MNRKRLFLALALGIALVLLCVSAALAEDPIKVSMELSKYKFSGPETITVSITVTNIGDGDMPAPVTLYYPSGKKIEEFGSPTLSVGASKRWTGDWKVTQAQLEAGKVAFKSVSIPFTEIGGVDIASGYVRTYRTDNKNAVGAIAMQTDNAVCLVPIIETLMAQASGGAQ